jgi:exopolysaccharide biosynthesis polyprenyl glycosylphosphotransferase
LSDRTQTKSPFLRRGALRRGWSTASRRLVADGPPYDIDISPVWEAVPGERGTPGWRHDTVLRRGLAVADVLGVACGLLIVITVLAGAGVALTPAAVLVAPFTVLASKALGLYDRDQHIVRKTTIDEVPALIYLSVLIAMSVWLAQGAVLDGGLDRPEVFMLALVTFGAILTARLLTRHLVSTVSGPEKCIIIGDVDAAARVVGKLNSATGVNAQVVSSVPLQREGAESARRRPTSDAALLQAISRSGAERVIITPEGHDQDEVLHVIRLIKALGVKVSVVPRLLEVVGSSSTFEDIDGMTLLGVRQYGVSRSSESLKRLMDIIGATVGLIVLAPLIGILAIAIKLDSRGPVFFRQRRIGRQGERFAMIKFRSMVPNAAEIKHQLMERNEVEGGLFKIAEDPRITRIGRFLRRTSLDEIPQLFNVLAGSMSLVGPRPLVEDEDALIEGWQRRRLAVKPGMTGMWQIFGSSRIPMQEMVKIDYLYGANWSLWLDLKILLRTIPYVLRRRGL